MNAICLCNKVAYATKREAKAAKRSCQRAARAGDRRRHEQRIYRCPAGGGWHLTSIPAGAWDGRETRP